MVFGRGKIDISIQKTSYAPGDTISGSVDLTLKKAVKAREMTISLIGEYMTRVTTRQGLVPGTWSLVGIYHEEDRKISMSNAIRESAPMSDLKTHIKTVRVYGSKQQLDGESEYDRSRGYHFKIRIPADISTSSVINWYLLAKLDIRRGLDITKKVRVTIV